MTSAQVVETSGAVTVSFQNYTCPSLLQALRWWGSVEEGMRIVPFLLHFHFFESAFSPLPTISEPGTGFTRPITQDKLLILLVSNRSSSCFWFKLFIILTNFSFNLRFSSLPGSYSLQLRILELKIVKTVDKSYLFIF